MKFCHECGYKLEGYEKVCPECGNELKNPEDTEYFVESIFNQFLDDMNHLKNNTLEMLDDIDIGDAFDDFSKNSKNFIFSLFPFWCPTCIIIMNHTSIFSKYALC